MTRYEYDEGYCSDTIVRRRRRESCQSFTCISPWFILFHLFSGGKTKSSRNKWWRKWEKKKMERGLGVKWKSRVANGVINHEASSSSGAAADSAEIWKEASINLGVGFGLVYLAVSSRNEQVNNKIVELHQKMELLFQNFNAQFENQDNKSTSSSCLSNTRTYCDRQPEFGIGSIWGRGENSLRMDQLEAELTAEFDRLQLQTDTDNFSSNKPYSEVNVEFSAPEESQSVSFEEITAQSEFTELYSVPPNELKRRLHEVLEVRQQERIEELESALEFAMHELEQKERQLSWWKDTARLISQHLPHIPSFLMKDETRILSMTYHKTLL